MMCSKIISFIQVKAVGIVSLVAAVEVNGLLAGVFCQLVNMIKQLSCISFLTRFGKRADVVDVDNAATVEQVHIAETGESHWPAVFSNVSHFVSFLHQLTNGGNKIFFYKVRAKCKDNIP